ncbi:mas-related G-protein coupled receptor member X4-like [Suncus etruscus]|uniref:mas-related G-protein coupled receptor member X4-like n=1 Tax=Suncus etruscus TaxID=109475 RepID=UPI002110D0A4|nr:mas-related G-protein coupled receptor member X4-like [Suncus etruscus]
MVGNGIVIWLLGFRLKRNHFSVYILNLAIADFTNLSSSVLQLLNFYISIYTFINFVIELAVYSYLVGLSLLMAISIEHCVSVLWPIWYKCYRPTHLSTIVCALIWVLFLIFVLMITVFPYWNKYTKSNIYNFSSLPTFLVLFVCSLTLFIRVQCYSQQRKPSRLYWTILLNVLAFLLLCVPRTVYKVCMLSMELSVYHSEILFFMTALHFMNSAVNPIIYFFIGRHRQWGGQKTPSGSAPEGADG